MKAWERNNKIKVEQDLVLQTYKNWLRRGLSEEDQSKVEQMNRDKIESMDQMQFNQQNE